MKKMRVYLLTAMLGVAAVSLFFASCKTDKCKNVVCQNSGVCDEGKCDCPPEYEGSLCETSIKTKNLGVYVGHGSDDQGGTNMNWSVHIADSNSSDPTAIYLHIAASAFQYVTFTGRIDPSGNVTLRDTSSTYFLYSISSCNITAGKYLNIVYKESGNPGGTNPVVHTFENMVKR